MGGVFEEFIKVLERESVSFEIFVRIRECNVILR